MIEPIGENAQLKVGDKVKVRIELRVDRDMEYMHLKDMRASAFEPVNVLSGYRWQQGAWVITKVPAIPLPISLSLI